MDDFLGTSIQYSEYQIKLLEREHYENQQKIVEDLINSGFLDSDYEEDTTTDNESSEASLEIKENEENMNESPLIQSVDDSDINISPKSLTDDSSTSIEIEEELSSPSSSTIINNNNENNDNLAMVLGSDISVVDELNVSNSESINDASINNQIIHSQQRQYRQYSVNHNNIDNDNECKVQGYEHENQYDSDDQMQEIQQFELFDGVISKSALRIMDIIVSDNNIIKYLMILFILVIAMPHIIDRAHQNDNIYGGVNYQSSGYQQHGCHEAHFSTEIYWTLDRAATTQPIINEEDDERDEYQNDEDEVVDGDVETTKQCMNKPHILKFDIISTKMDKETRKLRGHLSHHEFKIHASDLLSCHGNKKNINNIKFLGMRMKNMPIPREMPGLFMKIGAGFKGHQMMGKYTSIATHFTRSHGIYALVMAFVGIAGFAASNGIDEIITISS